MFIFLFQVCNQTLKVYMYILHIFVFLLLLLNANQILYIVYVYLGAIIAIVGKHIHMHTHGKASKKTINDYMCMWEGPYYHDIVFKVSNS